MFHLSTHPRPLRTLTCMLAVLPSLPRSLFYPLIGACMPWRLAACCWYQGQGWQGGAAVGEPVGPAEDWEGEQQGRDCEARSTQSQWQLLWPRWQGCCQRQEVCACFCVSLCVWIYGCPADCFPFYHWCGSFSSSSSSPPGASFFSFLFLFIYLFLVLIAPR